jgi:acetate kinase
MNILVLNCGSSSLKFQLIETSSEIMQNNADLLKAKGIIERIGSQSIITLQVPGHKTVKHAMPLRNHKAAIEYVLNWLVSPQSGIEGVNALSSIDAVGHRIVHGGEAFTQSTLIDNRVLESIEECIELAPLHNPANLAGIRAITEIFGPGIPQGAVFDTAFHSRMPESSYLYALPYQFYRRYKIRRYGFHGTSHRYVAYRYRKMMQMKKEDVKIITLHLGNGCSACAIDHGWSVDTSMGMTPLEGLMMGTRSGDIDPAILEFLALKEGFSITELDNILNKQSGLLGVSGLTHDMRELLEEEEDCQDRRAKLAIDIFCRRVKKYIGAYLAELGGAQAVIFTGGIGENSPIIRKRILSGLECFGIELDEEANLDMRREKQGYISTESSKLPVIVIPTNEELLIARDTVRCIETKLGR